MTTLHKLDDTLVIMSCSNGDQYIISNDFIAKTKNVDTSGLEQMPFDITVQAMVDNAKTNCSKFIGSERKLTRGIL